MNVAKAMKSFGTSGKKCFTNRTPMIDVIIPIGIENESDSEFEFFIFVKMCPPDYLDLLYSTKIIVIFQLTKLILNIFSRQNFKITDI